MNLSGYSLGHSPQARRRLELQDRQHAAISEKLLDCLELRLEDRVVEFGVGTGNFGRRILRRLGERGVLVGVDNSSSVLDEACQQLGGAGRAQFEPVVDDVCTLGSWLDGAQVVLGRTILHHIPMVEVLLGVLYTRVRPGTRIGFIEPEFRLPVARIARSEREGRPDLAPLRYWAQGIIRYYQARNLSPDIGATLPQVMEMAGYRNISHGYCDFPMDRGVAENALMYYEEVGPKYLELGIMTPEEIEVQKQFFAGFQDKGDHSMWGMHYAACTA